MMAAPACRLSLMVLMAVTSIAAQQPRYKETVEVSRILIDARVVNRIDNPLLGLDVADFAVKIDGKPAPVESVQWIGGSDHEAEPESAEIASPRAGSPKGLPRVRERLIVFLVQKDLERGRITGLMQAMTEAPAFLSTFTPEDRLAVLSFDFHLKVWLDFTNDLEQVRRVLQRGVIVEQPRALNQAGAPSLVERLERSRASRTFSIEDALTVIADALAPLQGSKTVVLLGYGFGRLSGGRAGPLTVILDQRYEKARRALQNARASVFCLDITNADYHSLEAGLQAVAEDTGGFFVRTHIFTRNAFDRVAAALAGHYVLFVEKPDIRRGVHRIDVKLTRHAGTIYAKNAYVD